MPKQLKGKHYFLYKNCTDPTTAESEIVLKDSALVDLIQVNLSVGTVKVVKLDGGACKKSINVVV